MAGDSHLGNPDLKQIRVVEIRKRVVVEGIDHDL